jgi:hypothetical protein
VACCHVAWPQVSGKYVVVVRGNCTFPAKALSVGEAGGAGMLLVNSEAGAFRMSGFGFVPEGEEEALVPSIMLTPNHGQQVGSPLPCPLSSPPDLGSSSYHSGF